MAKIEIKGSDRGRPIGVTPIPAPPEVDLNPPPEPALAPFSYRVIFGWIIVVLAVFVWMSTESAIHTDLRCIGGILVGGLLILSRRHAT